MKSVFSHLKRVFFLLLLTTAVSCAYNGYQVMNTHIINSGIISDRDISEASGIAASLFNDDILWVINDSGNSPSVYALGSNGKKIGKRIWMNRRRGRVVSTITPGRFGQSMVAGKARIAAAPGMAA